MLLAEAVCAGRRDDARSFRVATYLTSAIANNLPDVDFIYTWITRPPPLGSLLHHRGHTHTLVLALPLGWLVAFMVLRLLRARGAELRAVQRRWVWALGVSGSLLHVLMDFGNNYGVHPFWPFSGLWFYGDSIFIIEPLWWAIAIPVLVSAIKLKTLRFVLVILLLALVALGTQLPFVPLGVLSAVVLMSALAALMGWKTGPRGRIAFALGAWLAIAVVFVTGAAHAKARLRALSEASFPALTLHDIAVTPAPGHPLCYSALLVGEQGAEYRVLLAKLSLAPNIVAATNCPEDAQATPTARLEPMTRPPRPELIWTRQYRTSLAELRRVYQQDCQFRALMRFVRIPYLSAADAVPQIAGDLRYDRSPGLDFSDLELGTETACPQFVPGWAEPRAALLRDQR
jgi:inner membrane protein